jgi:hypothetical protein
MDCVCSHNFSDGMQCESTTGSVECCTATQNSLDGMHLMGACRMSVSESSSHGNGGAGIHLDAGVTLTGVQDNDVMNDSVGIRIQSPGNLVVRNTALGNGTDYDLGPTSAAVVPLSQLPVNDNPHANYSS